MTFFLPYWPVIAGLFALFLMACLALFRFAGLPTKKQISKIKVWLVYAVTEAEKELGNGTGQLKLKRVYDIFVTRFPVAACLISYQTFSGWVDEALISMRELLQKNPAISDYVNQGGSNP